MREIGILAHRYLRSALRTRAARVLMVVYLVAVLAAIWLPSGDTRGGSTLVLFSLVALALLVYGVASGVGNGLPEDRRMGRVEWLRTTAPPPWKHRAGLVVAGWTLALLAGSLGGLVAAVAATMGAPDFELRPSTDVELPGGGMAQILEAPVDGEPGPLFVLNLPPEAEEGGTVELEIRPRPLSPRLFDYADLEWQTDAGVGGEMHASVWTPIRIDVPPGTHAIALRSFTSGLRLRVLDARTLGSPRAPTFVLLVLAGVLMGFMAGAATPVGVVISRFTSGATASAAAFCLLCYWSVKGPLLGLVDSVEVEGAARFATFVLSVSGWIGPNLPTLELIGEYASGRTVGEGAPWWIASLIVYAAAWTLLASVPLPATWTERKLAS